MIDKILRKIGKITGAEYRQTTYSQAGEDIIMELILERLRLSKVSYLDIGTNHPKKFNNTYFFYKKGHNGVCVEPNPALAKTIKRVRPNDKTLNVGLSSGEEYTADFFVLSADTLSTFSKEDAEKLDAEGTFTIKEKIPIELKNVNNIIAENFADKGPTIISLDVEGWNEEIIRSFDFAKYKPEIFCIETTYFEPDGKIERIEGIFEVMKENGYKIFSDNQINTIFVTNIN
jgi:FkbM family methyltransferase